MTKAEQVSLGTTLAGTNQYKILSAVMSNFDSAVRATDASLNSEGTTLKQNEVYMQSLEAKVQALKTEFEKLVLGDGGLRDFAKTLVDIGTNILRFANSDAGQLLIKMVAIEASVVLAFNAFIKLKDAVLLVKDAF